MDRRERTENLGEALIVAMTGWQAGIWTALPVIIQSFAPDKQTCSAQAAVQVLTRNQQGVESWVSLPLLVDVPVYFPSGGGYSLTFPVQEGDEALAVFSSKCIDSWWQQGGPNNVRPDLRMHDLSDAIVFVGIKSIPQNIPDISEDGVQLRDNAGTTYVGITDGVITFKSPSLVKIDAPNTQCNNLEVTGTLTANGKNVGSTHTHGGVTTGVGTTGVPS